MKWKIKNDVLEDETGLIICTLPENINALQKALIKNASEMFEAIMDYAQSCEKTSQPRNPKMHYDRFQKILENIVEDAN